MQLKVASRTQEELKTAREKVNEIFKEAVGHDKKGRVDPRGVKRLDDDRVEIAALVVQLIEDQVALTDPTPFMVDRRSYGLGDQILFQELRGDMKVTNRAYGSKPLSQRLTKEEFHMTTQNKEIAAELSLEEIAAGSITAADAIDAIAEGLVRHRVQFVLDGIDAGIPAATADLTGVAGFTLRYAGLTAGNLEKALDGLKDDGEAPTIFARHIALYPAIRAFTGWSDLTVRDFEQRGVTGVYQGSPIVALNDKYSRKAQSHVIPSNRVYIAGGTKGAVMGEVDMSFLNWATVDARTATFTTGVRLEEGLLVWNPYAYRIIEIA